MKKQRSRHKPAGWDKHYGAKIMKQKVISMIVSIALAVFAMAAGAACYHQYLTQRGQLRTSQAVYTADESIFKEEVER